MKLTKEDIKKYGTEKEKNILKEKGEGYTYDDGYKDGYKAGYNACKEEQEQAEWEQADRHWR